MIAVLESYRIVSLRCPAISVLRYKLVLSFSLQKVDGSVYVLCTVV